MNSASSGLDRPLQIFLVENHADTAKWLARYLEQLGHSVAIAKTMTEALAVLPASEVDVLISDIGLPDGNGWDLLQRLQLPHPVFAIAMSGFGAATDRAKSEAAGFRYHMMKPSDPDELEGILREAAQELATHP